MTSIAKAGVAVAGLAMVTTTFAQTGGVLEEIIVTTERREAVLQDVPVAVSAFSADQIDKLQITQAQDLQRYAPSLNMFGNVTHPSNLSLSLRGGLQQDASLIVAESPIGIYIDDIYVGRLNGNNVTLSDIERVEVLRGPQGTLYGRNTGYGAIKFITKTPEDEFWFDATGGLGTDDQQLISASVGGPIADGWGASLSGQSRSIEGAFKNIAKPGDGAVEEDNTDFRGKLHYFGTNDFDAVLQLSYSQAENDSLPHVFGVTPNVPGGCDEFPSGECDPAAGEIAQFTTDDLVFPNGEFNTNTPIGQLMPPPLSNAPTAETEQTIAGLTLTWDLANDVTFKSISAYVGVEDFFHTDFSGNTGSGAPGFVGGSTTDSDQWTQEFQLLGDTMGGRLNYIFGLYYLNEDANEMFGWNFITPLSQSVIGIETDSYAVFGQLDYEIIEGLTGTLGARWTRDEKVFTFDFERFAGNAFMLPGTVEDQIRISRDFDDVTPTLGLSYAFETAGILDSGLVYIEWAEGFKGGGFSAIALASTSPVGAYNEESNETIEVGFKADWFDNRLRTNLAYFFSDIEDIQQNATDPTGPGFEFPVQNSGDAEIDGIEFEISWVPLEGLTLFSNGTLYLDPEYKNLNTMSAAFAATELFGVQPEPPQTADYQFSVGANYTSELPGDVFDEFSIGTDYYEIDDYRTAATNDFHNSGWDIWNAYASVSFQRNWEAKVKVTNLGDDFIVTSGSRGLGGFIALNPREYLFTITYRYD